MGIDAGEGGDVGADRASRYDLEEVTFGLRLQKLVITNGLSSRTLLPDDPSLLDPGDKCDHIFIYGIMA